MSIELSTLLNREQLAERLGISPSMVGKMRRSGNRYAKGTHLAAYNLDHPRTYPISGGRCPVCGHKGCFGKLPKSPDRWHCFSTDHPDGAGLPGTPGHHSDALDIDAFMAGRSRLEHLKAAGYWNGTTPTKKGILNPLDTSRIVKYKRGGEICT